MLTLILRSGVRLPAGATRIHHPTVLFRWKPYIISERSFCHQTGCDAVAKCIADAEIILVCVYILCCLYQDTCHPRFHRVVVILDVERVKELIVRGAIVVIQACHPTEHIAWKVGTITYDLVLHPITRVGMSVFQQRVEVYRMVLIDKIVEIQFVLQLMLFIRQ